MRRYGIEVDLGKAMVMNGKAVSVSGSGWDSSQNSQRIDQDDSLDLLRADESGIFANEWLRNSGMAHVRPVTALSG